MEEECVSSVTPLKGQTDTKRFLEGHTCLSYCAWEPSSPEDLDLWQANEERSQSTALQSEKNFPVKANCSLASDRARHPSALMISRVNYGASQ